MNMNNGGDLREKAIIILARTEKEGIAAEYEHISCVLEKEGVAWKTQSQRLRWDDLGKAYDVLTVLLADGRTREFVFDITSFFGQSDDPALNDQVARIIQEELNPRLKEAFSGFAGAGKISDISVRMDLKRSGTLEEKIKMLEEEARRRPEDSRTHFILAEAYIQADRWREAIEPLKRSMKTHPDPFTSNFLLGNLLIRLGRHQEALQPLQRAVEIQPEHFEAQVLLGITYGELKNYTAALGIFEKLISIEPENSQIQYFLGLTYFALDRYQETILAYQRVIELDSDNAQAHFNLGVTHLKIGNRFAALEEHRILKTLDRTLVDKFFKCIY